LLNLWPAAACKQDDKAAAKLTSEIFSSPNKKNKIPLLARGSSFQIKVWQALLSTKPGQTISYSQLAQMAGSPQAQRAVGSAMAANPIAYLIPCHRVIKKCGALGNYGGGTKRKQKILNWEAKTR
jgi:AraC family transcriptional regulator of adaptative response/methylated-DNA-[protein]-cysteine methyltransferase